MRSSPLYYAGLIAFVLFATAAIRHWDPAMAQRMRAIAFDTYQQLSPRQYDPATPIRIVDIDDASLAARGQWPWPSKAVDRVPKGRHNSQHRHSHISRRRKGPQGYYPQRRQGPLSRKNGGKRQNGFVAELMRSVVLPLPTALTCASMPVLQIFLLRRRRKLRGRLGARPQTL